MRIPVILQQHANLLVIIPLFSKPYRWGTGKLDIDTFARQLKIERLRRGWTLKQVSDLTRISITVLKLLEEKEFARIGEKRTIEMLLRTYSNAFGEEELGSGSFFDGFGQTGARQPYGGKLRSSPYLPPILAAGLVMAIIAVLVVAHNRNAIKSIRPEGRSTDTTIEERMGEPKIEQNTAASGEMAKNAESPGEERPGAVARGTEDHAEESKVESGGIAVTSEEGNKSPTGEANQSAGILPEQQEAPPPESAVNNTQPSLPSTPDDAQHVSEEQSVPSADQSSAPAVAPPAVTVHQLEILAAQKTWIQVTIDEERPESELLQPGETRKWQASQRAELIIGNRGGVELKWDGKPVDLGAGTARVIRLSLTDGGIFLK